MIIGAGETAELTARALADAGRDDDVRRQPPRATARRSLAERFGGARRLARRAARRSSSAPTSSSPRPSSPHPIVGAEELALVMATRGGRPLLLIDIAVPRDIEPACADDRRRDAARHRRPAGRRRAQPRGPRGRARAAPRRSSRTRSSASPRWLGASSSVAADDRRAARARRRDRRAGAGRERRPLGVSASPRDLARVEAIARAVDAAACCTSRRSA